MLRKFTWYLFFILCIISMFFAIISKDNMLYSVVAIGLSYVCWSFAFIFSTPFHWIYKLHESVYVLWFVGITCYLYYADLYIVCILFIVPVLIHFMSWGRKHEENALIYMMLEIEETKDEKKYQIFIQEVAKRQHFLINPQWFVWLANLEKLMKQQREKTKENEQ